MKLFLSPSFPIWILLLFLFSFPLCGQQILKQDFDELEELENFQGNPPGQGQVNNIDLNLPDNGVPIFSLQEEEGNKFLLIRKQGRKFRHFIRHSGFEDLPSLVIRFKFSVQEAPEEASRFMGVFIGKNLEEVSFYPEKVNQWGTLVISFKDEDEFDVENYLPEDGEEYEEIEGNGVEGALKVQQADFSGEKTITIVANNSGGILYYEDADGEEVSLGNRQMDVWVGEERKINNAPVYSGASSDISEVKFLTWGNPMSGSAILDDLSIQEFSDTPLPVRLLNFNAKVLEQDVLLEWQTASEENSDYFVIERSIDGHVFDSVGWLNSVGDSKSLEEYLFRDKKVADFMAGKVYYRLKQVDNDGAVDFSQLVLVELPEEEVNISWIYPNPFTDHLDVSIQLEKGQQMIISLYDLLGTPVVEEQEVIGKWGSLPVFRLAQLGFLPSGMYLLEIKIGSERKRYHLIKL